MDIVGFSLTIHTRSWREIPRDIISTYELVLKDLVGSIFCNVKHSKAHQWYFFPKIGHLLCERTNYKKEIHSFLFGMSKVLHFSRFTCFDLLPKKEKHRMLEWE